MCVTNKKGRQMEKAINQNKNWLGWLNLVVMVILAVLGYIFVQRNTAQLAYYNTEIAKIDLATRWGKNMQVLAESFAKTEESRANAVLARLNANLARLEGEVKSVKDRQEIWLKQTQVLTVFSEFMNNMRPKATVIPLDLRTVRDGFVLRYKLENYGKYPVEFSRPTMIIAREKLREGEEARGELRFGEDYTLESLSRPGEISGGASQEYQVRVIPLKSLPGVIYTWLTFPIQTPKAIVHTLAPFVEGLMKEQDLNTLSSGAIAASSDWVVPPVFQEKVR